MPARKQAAPPSPWSQGLEESQIKNEAQADSVSNLSGNVRVGNNVFIAPGSSIRADDSSTSFYLGNSANIQDGVVLNGLEKGRVKGEDQQAYSIWIGNNTCITQMSLIHGPTFIGDDCFVGFRSTILNSKVGNGCIIMMHVLLQDVEIPSNKYIPSGSVITSQEQVEQLPDVKESDRFFARQVIEINEALLTEYQCVEENSVRLNHTQKNFDSSPDSSNISKNNSYINSVEIMSSNNDTRSQLSSLLAQGCTITVEHANKRRFKTKSWITGGTISGTREDQIIAQLNKILQEHEGEYVKLVGVDRKAKKRVLEIIVQRPGDANSGLSTTSSTGSRNSFSSSARSSFGGGVSEQIGALLSQGCSLCIERASKRRFRTKSWLTVGTLKGSASQVMSELESLASQYPQDYLQVIGVDTGEKKRLAEIIVQRPGEGLGVSGSNSLRSFGGGRSGGGYRESRSGNGALSAEVQNEVNSLLASGYKIGTEHASLRRFKTKSWQTCSPIASARKSDVIAALEACLQEHSGEYVRLIGIDPNARRRVSETIIQRPGSANSTSAAKSSGSSFKSSNGGGSFKTYANGNGNGNGNGFSANNLDSETLKEVRSLLSAGLKIGTEHANKRRFKTKSWKTCSPIESNNESSVVAALEACLKEHAGEYVRMIGIDAVAKRRVSEKVIQRP